jgi:hypothetical protein
MSGMTSSRTEVASLWDWPYYKGLEGRKSARQVNSTMEESIAENKDDEAKDFLSVCYFKGTITSSTSNRWG